MKDYFKEIRNLFISKRAICAKKDFDPHHDWRMAMIMFFICLILVFGGVYFFYNYLSNLRTQNSDIVANGGVQINDRTFDFVVNEMNVKAAKFSNLQRTKPVIVDPGI